MSMFPFFEGAYATPGMQTVLETVENQPWRGRWEMLDFLPALISGAARDAGNLVTTVLRSGLLLGQITATGKWKEWNPTGTDGSQDLAGILIGAINSQMNATNQDRYYYVMIGGPIYADRLIIPGNATEGISGDALEYLVNQALPPRFALDKPVVNSNSRIYAPRYMTAAEVTADAVVVTEADNGRTFNFAAADAATAVTVPTAKVGLVFHFVNPVAQTITIAPAAGHIALPGSATDDSLVLTVGESATLLGVAAGLYMATALAEATD